MAITYAVKDVSLVLVTSSIIIFEFCKSPLISSQRAIALSVVVWATFFSYGLVIANCFAAFCTAAGVQVPAPITPVLISLVNVVHSSAVYIIGVIWARSKSPVLPSFLSI